MRATTFESAEKVLTAVKVSGERVLVLVERNFAKLPAEYRLRILGAIAEEVEALAAREREALVIAAGSRISSDDRR